MRTDLVAYSRRGRLVQGKFQAKICLENLQQLVNVCKGSAQSMTRLQVFLHSHYLLAFVFLCNLLLLLGLKEKVTFFLLRVSFFICRCFSSEAKSEQLILFLCRL